MYLIIPNIHLYVVAKNGSNDKFNGPRRNEVVISVASVVDVLATSASDIPDESSPLFELCVESNDGVRLLSIASLNPLPLLLLLVTPPFSSIEDVAPPCETLVFTQAIHYHWHALLIVFWGYSPLAASFKRKSYASFRAVEPQSRDPAVLAYADLIRCCEG
ncbi:hypothetical protein Syun_019323 [Stephania yunnanensis]|uniref:Uncharacterized protein n=1 Tax=Stephania yunnanensis TaxID=152371 RepID=A0AAP0NZB0_9MAGN